MRAASVALALTALVPAGLAWTAVVSIKHAEEVNGRNRRIDGLRRGWGFDPTCVAGGEDALAALARAREAQAALPFRLVILDAHMPAMDGFAVAEQIRQDPRLTPVTLMMLSSSGQAGDAARGRELGALPYVVKPVNPSHLLNTILTALVPAEAQHPTEEAAPASPPRRLRVMVAEDNKVNQRLITAILEWEVDRLGRGLGRMREETRM